VRTGGEALGIDAVKPPHRMEAFVKSIASAVFF
jgi:hypothetical protein